VSYFPAGFPTGTGMSWDDDDDEALPWSGTTPVEERHYCPAKGHLWADTGMKWTYCKACDIEGEWDMLHGYQISTRKT
jgi:hypothetical protein